MTEWIGLWQIAGLAITVTVGLVGAFKIHADLKRMAEQKRNEATDRETSSRLKRTEFFLSLHRRLFDDKDLHCVMCLIDSDDIALKSRDMWDNKRKFLTFFEEIELLIGANQINCDVAYYMFGYYARVARNGANFNFGINPSEEHWRLFFSFCRESEQFNNRLKTDPYLRPAL